MIPFAIISTRIQSLFHCFRVESPSVMIKPPPLTAPVQAVHNHDHDVTLDHKTRYKCRPKARTACLLYKSNQQG